MQSATQNTSAAAATATAKPIRVFHGARNGFEMSFDAAVGSDWAVAYAYCEENNRMSELFSHRDAGTLPALYAKLPFTYGKTSVACGDWMATARPAAPVPLVTAGDIQHVLEQYSLRVTDTQGKSFETMAAEMVDTLDLTTIAAAAATADSPAAKRQAVFDSLHQLLVKEGVIEF